MVLQSPKGGRLAAALPTIYGGAWDDRKGRPYAENQQVTRKSTGNPWISGAFFIFTGPVPGPAWG